MANITRPQRLLIPVPEVGALLGVGRTLAWRLVQTGELPSVRIGKRRLVPRAELEAYVQRLQREGAR
jgi:excisionase family DNA binding protein